MNNFDMVIATHKNLMMLEAQKIDLMKNHFDALINCAGDDQSMFVTACMYKVILDNEHKIMDSMKDTLKKYIEVKHSHEE